MIAEGTSVAHGAAMINYAMTKDKAEIIRIHNLPKGISPEAIWAEMLLHQTETRGIRTRGRELQNGAIRYEISPQNRESEGWTLEDYASIIDEINHEMKKLNTDPKTGQKKYNYDLDNVQYIAALHHDSISGIRHIHLVTNRVDMDGRVIDDHNLGRRLVKAVHQVNLRHGWELPEDIMERHIKEINEACMDALTKMQKFSWNEYQQRIKDAGLDVNLRMDNSGTVVGYTIFMGRSRFKASVLGTGRSLTARNIQKTWSKLHADQDRVSLSPFLSPSFSHNGRASTGTETRPVTNNDRSDIRTSLNPRPVYSETIHVDGKDYKISIPEEIHEILRSECQANESAETMERIGNDVAASAMDITRTAMLLYVGYVNAAVSMSENCGGGGSSPDSNWGKDPDEDDRLWARRCAQMARQMSKPRQRSFRRR